MAFEDCTTDNRPAARTLDGIRLRFTLTCCTFAARRCLLLFSPGAMRWTTLMIICMYEGTMRRVFDSSGDAIVNAALPMRYAFGSPRVIFWAAIIPRSLSHSRQIALGVAVTGPD